MPSNKFKVAVASDFLTAFSNIPKKQQAKVMDFVTKFRIDPTMPGINYEKIKKAKDQNLRSVRIDQAYRGIVMKPQTGNVYVLLWVDHHDKAYQWAENKVYSINPETGSLQVVNVEDAQVDYNGAGTDYQEREPLFSNIKDRHLVKLGVPELLLPVVRSVYTEADLDKIAPRFPEEASTALFMLAMGYSLEDTFLELDKSEKTAPIDTSDYEAALDNLESQTRFFIVEDDLELAAILNAPLEKWRIFLHPSQRKLVERDWNGPVRVLGGAGTGKTVAALHRAKFLASKVFTGANDRILFTTYTKNLAADIREHLRNMCSDETFRRIEVANLDKWVSDFLKRNGYDYVIDYGSKSNELWKKALDMAPAEINLPSTFYREEWERIIQPQEITSLSGYIKTPRVGRGVRLSRKDRQAIWPVFDEYRVLLNENRIKEVEDAMADARAILENKGDVLPYRSIVVDEAQDMSAQAFKLLRQMIPGQVKNDMFIVGDAHQRIYRHKVVLGQCGVNILGRGRKLRLNYRTTEQTRRWAVGLLKGVDVDDLNGGMDDQKGYKSLLSGLEPAHHHFDSFSRELDYISEYLENNETESGNLQNICLVVRTNKLVQQYEAALMEKGVETYQVRTNEPDDVREPGLRLATMHRVKGLEFDKIIIASTNSGVIPLENSYTESADPAVKRERENQERSLIYVAATRAKKEVLVTSYGEASPLL